MTLVMASQGTGLSDGRGTMVGIIMVTIFWWWWMMRSNRSYFNVTNEMIKRMIESSLFPATFANLECQALVRKKCWLWGSQNQQKWRGSPGGEPISEGNSWGGSKSHGWCLFSQSKTLQQCSVFCEPEMQMQNHNCKDSRDVIFTSQMQTRPHFNNRTTWRTKTTVAGWREWYCTFRSKPLQQTP